VLLDQLGVIHPELLGNGLRWEVVREEVERVEALPCRRCTEEASS
jgi:hypothetical protein